MELIFTAGARAGERLQIDEPIISIGRDLDNLVMLPVEGASRHHAEIRREDGMWNIVDHSTNGVRLNGRRVPFKAQLRDGDVIEIAGQGMAVNFHPPVGTVTFRPLEGQAGLSPEAAARRAVPSGYDMPQDDAPDPGKTSHLPPREHRGIPTPPPPPPPEAVLSHTQVDFHTPGKRPEPPPPPGTVRSKRGFSKRFYYLLLGCILAAGLLAFVVIRKSAVRPLPPPPAKFNMVLVYDRESITADNVFNYSLRFEDGCAYFNLTDLESGRNHTRVIDDVTESTLKDFLDRMERAGFFALLGRYERAQTGGEGREFRRIRVVTPERSHDVTITDGTIPDAFDAIERLVENFAAEHGLVLYSMTSEEMINAGRLAYETAVDHEANRHGNPANYLLALHQYRLALEYLEQFHPEEHAEVRRRYDALEQERQRRLGTLRITIRQASQVNDTATMREALNEMRLLLDPGLEPEEYQKVRDNLIRLEAAAQSGRRR